MLIERCLTLCKLPTFTSNFPAYSTHTSIPPLFPSFLRQNGFLPSISLSHYPNSFKKRALGNCLLALRTPPFGIVDDYYDLAAFVTASKQSEQEQFSFSSSNMKWAYSTCTFSNRNQRFCEMCSFDRNVFSASYSDDDDPQGGIIPQMEGTSEWSCSTCTFVNSIEDSTCEMCGGSKADLSSEDPQVLKERILNNTKLWPLRKQSQPSNAGHMVHEPKCVTGSTTKAEPISAVALSPRPSHSNLQKRKVKNEAEEAHPIVIDRTIATAVNPKDEFVNANIDLKKANAYVENLHLERSARQSGATVTAVSTDSCKSVQPIVIMTYNVWFQDLEVHKRMAAIGDIIQEHKPHVICFQEVTPNIYNVFQKSHWWSEYKCSVPPELAVKRAYFCLQLSKFPVAAFYRNPFCNTIMGRELCIADLEVGNELQLVVATTHLESPCPAPPTWNQMFSGERVFQANESLSLLKPFPNVVFGGDMNWDDKLDGPPPMPDGWMDVWLKLHPGQPGLTYDSKANPMLTGSRLQKRLDRFFCHLSDFDIESIEMIGLKAIPSLTYTKEKRIKRQTQVMTLPVLPSDHFGLLLKITKRVDAEHF
ncbi:hypothetical protein O6H91_02G020600 [Diphasiastrum complanatum]|uniref:Uncharacterized protein n=1 Tax=Diphasiastrum complanatum TaxID=34168 RepID=A0ACC2EDN1_DIPCM|nr:hypothetical protein O6H91_02G020600 [Diphasiastrum complanatum]